MAGVDRRGRILTTAVAVLVLSGLVGGVYAGARDKTPAPARATAADDAIEERIDALLADMTLPEKLGQLNLVNNFGPESEEAARTGTAGSMFGNTDPEFLDHLQHLAVEQSPHGIPILFAFDTIHGFKTIFPIPLGVASSFDPSVAAADHRIGARESAAVGIKQIYSPMVDVSHEPRWGRVAEGAGEDPYLSSVLAVARVHAAQGEDYSAPEKVVTSPKHFAAYGQPEGGRDYNTTDMSEHRLRDVYLPPFKAAVEAGADTIMCSFNALNGVPGCANQRTENQILRQEW